MVATRRSHEAKKNLQTSVDLVRKEVNVQEMTLDELRIEVRTLLKVYLNLMMIVYIHSKFATIKPVSKVERAVIHSHKRQFLHQIYLS